MSGGRPRLAVTLGDPRGIGPEVAAAAARAPEIREAAELLTVGPEGVLPDALEVPRIDTGRWDPAPGRAEELAGRLAARAVERACDLALADEVDGIVTAPLSKAALAAAGRPWPGHTEFLRDRTGVEEVTMMMVAEATPLDGPLRMALLTGHVPLREVPDRLTPELVFVRSRIAGRALREWWGLDRPTLAFAGVNPHASEGGLFGDEEARVLEPAMRRLQERGEGIRIDGLHPADTVFRRCLDGRADAVVVPYHDVGLAVLKTVALESGVNVTAGLPFPRTSPDHGTAFDIAGRGEADPSSMIEAVRLCARFCAAGNGRPGREGDGGGAAPEGAGADA